jgi:hypothetical protein
MARASRANGRLGGRHPKTPDHANHSVQGIALARVAKAPVIKPDHHAPP